MDTNQALDTARKASTLIREAANLIAYDPESSRLTATLHALADKLEPVVETALIIPFPSPEEITS